MVARRLNPTSDISFNRGILAEKVNEPRIIFAE
jgi:hypothetical protein